MGDATKRQRAAFEAAPGITIGSVHHTEPICRVSGHLMPLEANARLIAAAPDLLAVLKAIQFGANRRCPSCAGWMCGPNGETDNAHTDDCSVAAALRKAEGHV